MGGNKKSMTSFGIKNKKRIDKLIKSLSKKQAKSASTKITQQSYSKSFNDDIKDCTHINAIIKHKSPIQSFIKQKEECEK